MKRCGHCGHPQEWHSHDDHECLETHPQPCAPEIAPFRCLGYDCMAEGFVGGTPASRCGCPDFAAPAGAAVRGGGGGAGVLMTTTPLLDVVRRVVWPLRSEGRVYRGRCPFHQEATPSFYVDPDAGVFHCFGCGVGGDVEQFTALLEQASARDQGAQNAT